MSNETPTIEYVSLERLAQWAEPMPWDTSPTDVPFHCRYDFKKAVSAECFLGLLSAAKAFITPYEGIYMVKGSAVDKAREAVAMATVQNIANPER